jgi:hypothetical protein
VLLAKTAYTQQQPTDCAGDCVLLPASGLDCRLVVQSPPSSNRRGNKEAKPALICVYKLIHLTLCWYGVFDMREELPFPDKVLQTLHNLCATAADLARRGEEVARLLQKDPNEIESILDRYKSEGFAESFYDNEGKKRYYLNGRGIIKVCSLFT